VHVCVCMCVCLQVWLGEGKKCGKGQATGIKFVEAASGIPQAKLVCAVIHTLYQETLHNTIAWPQYTLGRAQYTTGREQGQLCNCGKILQAMVGRANQLAFKTHPKRQS